MYQALIRMMQWQNSPCIFFTAFVFFSSRVLRSEMWFSSLKAVLFGMSIVQVRVFFSCSFYQNGFASVYHFLSLLFPLFWDVPLPSVPSKAPEGPVSLLRPQINLGLCVQWNCQYLIPASVIVSLPELLALRTKQIFIFEAQPILSGLIRNTQVHEFWGDILLFLTQWMC